LAYLVSIVKRSPFFVLLLLGVLATVQPKVCFAQDEQSANARKVISRVTPVYPQVARTMKLSGTVKLEVLVQANGSVKSAEVKGGNPVLSQSAQNAVRGWKWEKADHQTTEQVECYFSP
jgi:TonB family protein